LLDRSVSSSGISVSGKPSFCSFASRNTLRNGLLCGPKTAMVCDSSVRCLNRHSTGGDRLVRESRCNGPGPLSGSDRDSLAPRKSSDHSPKTTTGCPWPLVPACTHADWKAPLIWVAARCTSRWGSCTESRAPSVFCCC